MGCAPGRSGIIVRVDHPRHARRERTGDEVVGVVLDERDVRRRPWPAPAARNPGGMVSTPLSWPCRSAVERGAGIRRNSPSRTSSRSRHGPGQLAQLDRRQPAVLVDDADAEMLDRAAERVAQDDQLDDRHARATSRSASGCAETGADPARPWPRYACIAGPRQRRMMNGLSAVDGPSSSSRSWRPVKCRNTSSSVVLATPIDSTVTPRSAASAARAIVVAGPSCDVSRNCDPSPVTLSTPGKPRQTSAPVGRHAAEADLERRDAGHGGLEAHRRIERDQLAVIDDRDPVAELVRLIHVVRREQHGEFALGLDRVEHLPDARARDGIESGGRLVEEEDPRLVHEGPRAISTRRRMPPESCFTGLSAHAVSSTAASSSSMSLCAFARCGTPYSFAKMLQVLARRQVEVAGHRLRDHADRVPDGVRVLDDVGAVRRSPSRRSGA